MAEKADRTSRSRGDVRLEHRVRVTVRFNGVCPSIPYLGENNVVCETLQVFCNDHMDHTGDK